MAKRRIWRNKPKAEKERRRALNREKKTPVKSAPLVISDKFNGASPETEARYRALSPMMKETVDGMLALGMGLDQVMRGLS